MTTQRVGASRDLPEAGCIVVASPRGPIAVRRAAGRLVGILDVCPHRGEPVGEGVISDGIVTCPGHGWRFDIATGRCVTNPLVAVPVFAVREANGHIELEIPER